MPVRYAELTPEQLEKRWSEKPLAIIAWGALEWHGSHLPLGLDGIVAERGNVEIGCDFCGLQYYFDAVDVGELFTPEQNQPPSSSVVH